MSDPLDYDYDRNGYERELQGLANGRVARSSTGPDEAHQSGPCDEPLAIRVARAPEHTDE